MKTLLLTLLFLSCHSLPGMSLSVTSSLPSLPETVAQKGDFTNPVWNGADPWMVKKDNYYIYIRSANTNVKSILVSRSDKMTIKGEEKTIWTAPSSGWNRACVWAPEIHFIDERWWVYYAAGESGPPFIHQRTGVLRSKSSEVFSEYEDM